MANSVDQALFRDALVSALDASGTGDTAAQVDIAARALAGHYAEPVRAYHNADHIRALLQGLYATGATRSPALLLAILYHDVIYDPRRTDNETASAAFARAALGSLGVDAALISRVEDLILATRHGAATSIAADTECELLLDLDLAILGAGRDAYNDYAKAIRTEYAHVPDALYRNGRTQVLRGFLDLSVIYRTPTFRAACEPAARANLAAEIATLAAGL